MASSPALLGDTSRATVRMARTQGYQVSSKGRMTKDRRFWAFVIVLALVAIAAVLAVTTLVAPVPQ
jgi:hypothetical protein